MLDAAALESFGQLRTVAKDVGCLREGEPSAISLL